MTVRRVRLHVTEEALRLLNGTHADFSRFPVAPGWGRVRTSGITALGYYDFSEVRAQSEYFRLVSIVEAYVDTLSRSLFDVELRGHDILFHRLASAAIERSSTSWDERKSAFLAYHQVTLGSCARYSDVDAAVQVRNAIAHGLGSLTGRQQNTKDIGKIKSVGINLRGTALVIDTEALARCHQSCVQFIDSVDARLPN